MKRKGKHRVGEDGANEDVDDEVTDLISQVHIKRTVQLESRMRSMEAATCCTLFLPIQNFDRDRHARRKQSMHRKGGELSKL